MFRIFTILFFIIFNIQFSSAYPTKPNPNETKGELCSPKDPDFVEYRYKEKIPYCIRNVDSWTKDKIYDLYNIPEECRHRYTIDHFFPLAIGGNNNDINLWPEHKLVKATRPKLEVELYNAMKEGTMTQSEALKIIKKAKMEAISSFSLRQNATDPLNPCDKIDPTFEM